jgi:hypothetical protein
MLRENDLNIDLIGSPDHWHALNVVVTMEAGAEVFGQKPINVDDVGSSRQTQTAVGSCVCWEEPDPPTRGSPLPGRLIEAAVVDDFGRTKLR